MQFIHILILLSVHLWLVKGQNEIDDGKNKNYNYKYNEEGNNTIGGNNQPGGAQQNDECDMNNKSDGIDSGIECTSLIIRFEKSKKCLGINNRTNGLYLTTNCSTIFKYTSTKKLMLNKKCLIVDKNKQDVVLGDCKTNGTEFTHENGIIKHVATNKCMKIKRRWKIRLVDKCNDGKPMKFTFDTSYTDLKPAGKNSTTKKNVKEKAKNLRRIAEENLQQQLCELTRSSCSNNKEKKMKNGTKNNDNNNDTSDGLKALLNLQRTINSTNFSYKNSGDGCNSSCRVVLDIKITTKKEFNDYTFNDGAYDVVMPRNILKYTKNLRDNETVKVVTLVQKSIDEMMIGDVRLYNSFVSLTLNHKLVENLEDEDRIMITFPKDEEEEKEIRSNHSCVYWKGSYTSGYWDTLGCRNEKILSNETHTVCSCNHLTDFSVLMRVVEVPQTYEEKFALHIITTAGCLVSIVFLVSTVVIILYFKNLRKEVRFKIHFNLAISLLMGNFLFVISDLAKENEETCFSISIMLYYFFLTAFFWMLSEGVFIWRGLIVVFNTEDKFRYYFILSWGIPFFCTTLIASIFRNDFHETQSCWLSWDNFAAWAFVGPVVTISLINAVILYRSLIIMKKQKRKESVHDHGLISTARFTLMLLPVFGCTWVIGVFTVNDETKIFQYAFTVLNSLQGFFVFMFYIFCSRTVRKEFRRRVRLHRDKTEIRRKSSSYQLSMIRKKKESINST